MWGLSRRRPRHLCFCRSQCREARPTRCLACRESLHLLIATAEIFCRNGLHCSSRAENREDGSAITTPDSARQDRSLKMRAARPGKRSRPSRNSEKHSQEPPFTPALLLARYSMTLIANPSFVIEVIFLNDLLRCTRL